MKQDRQKQTDSHTGMSKGHEADELNKLLSVWLHSSIRVMDVRHIRLESVELFRPYRLPAHAFVFVLQGSVRLAGDWKDTSHSGYVVHGRIKRRYPRFRLRVGSMILHMNVYANCRNRRLEPPRGMS
ncbi:hypothetical protein [Paenibacillus brasilensis]|uniref:Uncharacterized protein n=1 Tax=Paenibacillus brasilensis TaxID=128574 RepID=A0ABU0L5A5_9BACL|nr:hypothetical protein [Paenibacillus brasilensis]MDQ0496465.1 hypothetical protein [Paenibacillus brasilensis]